jgi:hypothetical protein
MLREKQRRVRRKPRKRAVPRTPLSVFVNDQQVLTVPEWCQLNAIGLRTGRRRLAGGDGPIVTKLSAGRIGITVGNNRVWQQSRARGVMHLGPSRKRERRWRRRPLRTFPTTATLARLS